jgi:hypothetical protein
MPSLFTFSQKVLKLNGRVKVKARNAFERKKGERRKRTRLAKKIVL